MQSHRDHPPISMETMRCVSSDNRKSAYNDGDRPFCASVCVGVAERRLTLEVVWKRSFPAVHLNELYRAQDFVHQPDAPVRNHHTLLTEIRCQAGGQHLRDIIKMWGTTCTAEMRWLRCSLTQGIFLEEKYYAWMYWVNEWSVWQKFVHVTRSVLTFCSGCLFLRGLWEPGACCLNVV